MNNFNEIKSEQFITSPFNLIGNEWMLITASKDNKVNTMTASWGGLGVLWGKNVAYLVIRPNRYTKEFIDASDMLSLTFFDDSFKKQLSYLGSVSGREENKIEKSGLTTEFFNDTPYFSEAKNVLICKKLYKQELDPKCFLDNSLLERWYPDKDYHTLYAVEIQNIFTKA